MPRVTPSTTSGHVVAGRYRLISTLGSGGVGRVWQAQDELLGRLVAVKEFSPPLELGEAERETLLQRTLHEAKTAARLSHPNVVTIYDAVEDGGRPWIVMEMIPARSLRDLVRDHGPLEPHQAASIGVQVLAALRAAHALGITHRDVKPANVLIDGTGRAVLADFGIARTADSPTLTKTGMLIGSPSYIAPERAHGDHGGPESDLWSLGATLYAVVEGRPPYDRRTPLATLTAVVNEDPDPPRRCGALWPVISGLLARDPARRPSAATAERMLRRVAGPDPAGIGGTLPFPELAREPGRSDTRELPLPFTVPDQASPADSSPAEVAQAVPIPAEVGHDEPAPAPLSPAESGQDEPGQAALAPAEPSQEEPGQEEPGQPVPPPAEPGPDVPRQAVPPPAELSQDQPSQAAPAAASQAAPTPVPAAASQAAPAPADSGQDKTGHDEPADAEPHPAEPALASETQRGSAPAGPVDPVPAPAQPAPAQPGQAQPGQAQPGQAQPGQAQPAQAQPGQAQPGPRPRWAGRPRRPWLIGVAAVAVAAAVITAILVAVNPGPGRHPSSRASTPPGSPAASASSTAPASSTASASSTPSAAASPTASATGAALPPGYHRYQDPTGFAIARPAGWRISHQGHLVYLLPPSGAAFLLIDQSDHPKPNPLADWQQQEAARAGSYPGYHRIRLQAISYPQAEKAADWEFTYYHQGVLTHVLNRNVLADAHHAYALYWSTPASQWNQDRRIFDVFARTFQPVR